MFFAFEDTVPANTTRASSRKTTLKLAKGIAHRVDIHFPIGCSGLVHCVVYIGSHQLWPYNPSGYFTADGETISFPEWIEFTKQETKVVWETWNEDDTYDHTLILRIGILPKWAIMPPGATEGIMESLKSLVLRR